jgi:biopolymer transport protein ExbB/TolQ
MTEHQNEITPTRGLGLIIFFIAGWLAFLAYGKVVKNTYDGLVDSYEHGKALVAARDRLVPIRPEGPGPMTKPELVEVLRRLVPGAAQEITSVDSLGAFAKTVEILFKGGRDAKSGNDGTNGRPDEPTLFQMIALVCETDAAKGSCNPSGSEDERKKLDAALSERLARALAAVPLQSDVMSALPAWLRSILALEKKEGPDNGAQKFLSHVSSGHKASWRDYVRLSSPSRPRDAAILAALASELKVRPLDCIDEACESDKDKASYNAALKTALALMSALHQTDEVDRAWNNVRLIVGSEQLAIVFLSVLLLLTLVHLQFEYGVEAHIWMRLHRHLNNASRSRENWPQVLDDTSNYFERSTRVLGTPYSFVLSAWCIIASPATYPRTHWAILAMFLAGICAVGLSVLGVAGRLWLWVGFAALAVSSLVNHLRLTEEWQSDIGRAVKALPSCVRQTFKKEEAPGWWARAEDLAKRVLDIGRANIRLKPVLSRAHVRERMRQTSVADRIFRGHSRDVSGADQDEYRTTESESAVAQARDSLALRRSFLQWGVTALPALGFIGTVHGIMDALNEADQLTRPGATQGELAAAMSDITARLSLAFSTTLMALLAGLTIGLWVHLLTTRHERMLDQIQSYFPTKRAEHEQRQEKRESEKTSHASSTTPA